MLQRTNLQRTISALAEQRRRTLRALERERYRRQLEIGKLEARLAFPVYVYTDDAKNDECPICHDGYEIGQDLTILKCGHDFHVQCLGAWLDQKDTCPLCRRIWHSK